MQLRVARLCLDCEELHVADRCPVCASERYAFLSPWLPSEERRRWRRPVPASAEAKRPSIGKVVNTVAAWFGITTSTERPAVRTRAADHVPSFDFEPPVKTPKQITPVDPHHTPATRPRT